MRNLLAIIAVILTAAAFKLTVHRPEWYLVAQSPVPVYNTQIASTGANRVPATFLAKNERLVITRCIDAKHFLIIQVRLADGRAGFILDGDYFLRTLPVSALQNAMLNSVTLPSLTKQVRCVERRDKL